MLTQTKLSIQGAYVKEEVLTHIAQTPSQVFQYLSLSSQQVQSHTFSDYEEFHGVREYQLGDNFRHINWKASARTSKVFTNEYEHPKTQPCCLVLDQSSHLFFGTKALTKSAKAGYLAMAIGASYLKQGTQSRIQILGDTSLKTPSNPIKLQSTDQLYQLIIQFNHQLNAERVQQLDQDQRESYLCEQLLSCETPSRIDFVSDISLLDNPSAMKFFALLASVHEIYYHAVIDPIENQTTSLPNTSFRWNFLQPRYADNLQDVQTQLIAHYQKLIRSFSSFHPNFHLKTYPGPF